MDRYKERATGNFYIDPNNYFKEQFEAIREACRKAYESDNIIDTEIDNTQKIDESKPLQSDSKQCHTMPIIYDLEYVMKEKAKEKKKYEICCKALAKFTKELEDIANKGKNATGEDIVILRVKYRETLDIVRKLKLKVDTYKAKQFKEELESYHGRLLRSDYGVLRIVSSCHIEGEISLRLETEEKTRVWDKYFESKEAIMNYIKCYLV